jgi:RNA polymerase sigma-70 factor, ECF subfamily
VRVPAVTPQPTDPAVSQDASAQGATPRADASLPDLAAVLERAKGGDDEAWRVIVRHYAPRVFALVYSRCRDRTQAEDITQGVMASVAVHVCKGAYTEQGKFEPWLFRVAMNRARDLARSKARSARLFGARSGSEHLEQVADQRPPAQDGTSAPGVKALRDALQLLTAQDREVIELRHHAGLTFQAMAEVLEEPLGTLLARHHRALHKLRTLLANHAIANENNR